LLNGSDHLVGCLQVQLGLLKVGDGFGQIRVFRQGALVFDLDHGEAQLIVAQVEPVGDDAGLAGDDQDVFLGGLDPFDRRGDLVGVAAAQGRAEVGEALGDGEPLPGI
jgi:hypothetical protein